MSTSTRTVSNLQNIRPANEDRVHQTRFGVVLCDTVITGAVHPTSDAVTCAGCLETLRLAAEATSRRPATGRDV